MNHAVRVRVCRSRLEALRDAGGLADVDLFTEKTQGSRARALALTDPCRGLGNRHREIGGVPLGVDLDEPVDPRPSTELGMRPRIGWPLVSERCGCGPITTAACGASHSLTVELRDLSVPRREIQRFRASGTPKRPPNEAKNPF